MKNFILYLIFLNWFAIAMAQKSDTIAMISPPGKPEGNVVTNKIGKEGGSIVSEDGMLELNIPPGALNKNSDISIQAVSNTLQKGGPKVYHLFPADITFQKPAELIIHYEDKEHFDPDLYGIAWQDNEGHWFDLDNAEVDTTAKTIKGMINHFSMWANYKKIKLTCVDCRVKVNKSIPIGLFYLYLKPDKSINLVKVPGLPEWTVNSIKNGNKKVGTLLHGKEFDTLGTFYKAPDFIHDDNPVHITAEFKNLNYKIGKKTFTTLQASCSILVYDDAYEVKIEAVADNTNLVCGERWTDESSFIVELNGSKSTLVDIKNSMLKIPVRSKCRCKPIWVNQASTLGPIHIEGEQEIKVLASDPPSKPYNHVEIYFKPAKAVYPIYKYQCKGQVSTQYPSIPALPYFIEFDEKQEEQVFEKKDVIGNIKITVNQIKEE